MIDRAIVYQPKEDIAGVRPYFLLPNQDSVDYFDSCGGAPEAELITWAAQFLRPTMEFLDIGSHVGTWGITYATRGHGAVIGFEAQPWLARLCNAGFALNGHTGETAYCYDWGLWSETDQFVLRAPYSDGGGGSIVVGEPDTGYACNVLVRPLDGQGLHHEPGLMKIDAEGSELEILKGAKKTIERCQPTILFECWGDERGQRREELFRYLADDLDYKVVQVDRWPEMHLAEPK